MCTIVGVFACFPCFWLQFFCQIIFLSFIILIGSYENCHSLSDKLGSWKTAYRHIALYCILFNCTSKMLLFFFFFFLQIEGKTLHQQKDHNSLYCIIIVFRELNPPNSEVCESPRLKELPDLSKTPNYLFRTDGRDRGPSHVSDPGPLPIVLHRLVV